MAINIKLWRDFNKRVNSTKQPNSADSVEFPVVLKGDVSLSEPSFTLNMTDIANKYHFNYLQWGNRYYYLNNIVSNNRNEVEVTGSIDALATHKTAIGNTTAFVEYSQSDYNIWINDPRLSMEEMTTITQSGANAFTGETGTVIITVAGNDGQERMLGFTSPFAIDAENAGVLADYFYTDDVAEALQKFFNNPFESVIEAHYVPWDCTTGAYGYIMLGNTVSDALGHSVKNMALNASTTYHSLALNFPYNDFRAYEPYTRIYLFLPFVGTVNIDVSRTIENGALPSSVQVGLTKDPISGEIVYSVLCGAYQEFFSATTAIPLSIGQTSTGAVNAIASTVGGALVTAGAVASMVHTGGITAPAVVGAIGGVTAIGGGVVSGFKTDTMSKGGYGAFASSSLFRNTNLGQIRCKIVTHGSSQSPASMASVGGRPLFETRRIGTLSGFVKCAGASVNIAGLENEKELVNTFLNGGFYYE